MNDSNSVSDHVFRATLSQESTDDDVVSNLEAEERDVGKLVFNVGSEGNKPSAVNGVDELFVHLVARVPEKVTTRVV